MAKLVKVIRILFKCKFDFKKVKKEKMLIFDTLSLQLVNKFKKFEQLILENYVFCYHEKTFRDRGSGFVVKR